MQAFMTTATLLNFVLGIGLLWCGITTDNTLFTLLGGLNLGMFFLGLNNLRR